MSRLPSHADVAAAATRIAPYVRHTPLEPCAWLSAAYGAEVRLKLECWQPTGSFKLRGAMAALTALPPAERARGVVAASAGNHGQAIAWGARALGIPSTIVVPETASPAKIAALRTYPSELVLAGVDYDAAEATGRQLAANRGLPFISPYNDASVIAGQGTLAAELLEDWPDLDLVVVPSGGGGLLAGIALAASVLRPGLAVWGAEPEASPTMQVALAQGEVVQIQESPTLADGLAGNIEAGSMSYPLVAAHAAGIVLVSEAQIRSAMRAAAEHEHLILEGSAAVALAALSALPVAGKRVAVVATGRNVALRAFLAAVGAS